MGARVSDRLAVSRDVAAALAARRPVVALETTLVTHGLPFGEGLLTAIELEAEVRARGAVPATVGVLDGKLVVGLSEAELSRLASSGDVAKLNPSTIAGRLAGGGPGSTTVAATLFAAHRAGIAVLATGGIGGVHRGAGHTGDVSADLMALARFPVAVVCAGAKAVLDLARTLEALETLGVPVYGFGTDRFPAFYRRDSGLPLDRRFDAVGDLAAAVRAHRELGLGTGVVVANPIPAECEMPADQYEAALATALREVEEKQVRGREVTPFLLARLNELTEGGSVFSNRALLLDNARIAAELAAALVPRPAPRRAARPKRSGRAKAARSRR
jgi:pseudouridine-5'-phosphate glycosidase